MASAEVDGRHLMPQVPPMPLKHATGMSQHLMKVPQRACRLVQHVYLCHDLVLIGQGLMGIKVIPELDRVGERHLSSL